MTSALVAPSRLTRRRSVRGAHVKSGRVFMSGGHASRQVARAAPAHRKADAMAMVTCKAGFDFFDVTRKLSLFFSQARTCHVDRPNGRDASWLSFPSVLRLASGRLASLRE